MVFTGEIILGLLERTGEVNGRVSLEEVYDIRFLMRPAFTGDVPGLFHISPFDPVANGPIFGAPFLPIGLSSGLSLVTGNYWMVEKEKENHRLPSFRTKNS